ncbi:MAG: DUF3168 domain-containing protein [Azonexus sp.]
MRAEAVIYSLLTVAAGVTALVGPRIYPQVIAQDQPYPAIMFHKISAIRMPHISASLGANLVEARIQVSAFAKSYPEVKTLAEEIRKALIYKSGTYAGVQVVAVLFDLEGPDQFDDSNRIYYQPLDFLITHYE